MAVADQCDHAYHGSDNTSASTSGQGSTDCSESDSHASTVNRSILDQLRVPAKSDLGRKRKIHSNPAPPLGKKLSVTQHKSDPSSVHPSKRVSEFPWEQLCVSARKLFCKACRETVAIKRSVT